MERRLVITEKTKDTILNVLVVVSIGLALFFVFRSKDPTETQAPLNSQYAISRLQPLPINNLPLYTELTSLDETSSTTNQHESAEATAASAPYAQPTGVSVPANSQQTQNHAITSLQKILQNRTRYNATRLQIF